MGIKFKCKQTGNIFSFENAHDIKTMRTHPEYEEIKATIVEEPVNELSTAKKAGRPRKTLDGDQDGN